MSGEAAAGDLRFETLRGGAVRVIALARPDKRNAITLEMFTALTAAFEQEPPPEQRLTLLKAEGTVFCAGVDLGQRAEQPAPEGESPLERLCAAVRRHPLPVVAAVQGHAIGGGFMLAMHCDFVLAADSARLGNAAVQLGLVPPWPLARAVAAAVGPALARTLLLGGDLLPAPRLAAAHAIAAAVPEAELDAAVERVVDRLARNAPLSLRAVKATLGADAYVPAPHDDVAALLRRAQLSADAREGVAARREKREPRFTGR